jgi:hypothetical protein
MPISKLEAAQRQLDCAIRLYIGNDDLVAVHTLSRAAFRLLYDIYPTKLSDGFEKSMDDLIQRLGWKEFNRVTNFLKHADNDADERIPDTHRIDTDMGIGFACILYSRIVGRMTPEMRAFDMWMHAMHPEELPLPPDSDPEIDRSYRISVERLSKEPIDVQLIMATTLLQFYREHPEKL